MRKSFVTLLLVALSVGLGQSAWAQASFGFRAGANVSKIRSHILSTDNRGGFFVGAVLDVKIPVIPFGFDLGAMYDIHRVKAIDPDNGTVMRSNMQFISLPLNLRCPISLTKRCQLAASTGPQCDFSIGHKNILHENFRLHDATWSWNFGASFRIFKHYQLGYNYNVGITRIAKLLPDAGIRSTSAMRNNSHQVFVTYFF